MLVDIELMDRKKMKDHISKLDLQVAAIFNCHSEEEFEKINNMTFDELLTNITESYKRLEQGIYQMVLNQDDAVFKLSTNIKVNKDIFGDYGVCDNIEQIKRHHPNVLTDDKKYIIIVTKIKKKDQPAEGGWRWHKWGPYIGDKKPQCEYLYDEPKIDKVLVYHIYTLV